MPYDPEKAQEARDLHATGMYSQKTIARMLGITEKAVGFYLNPEMHHRNLEYQRNYWRTRGRQNA